MRRKIISFRFAICIDNAEYPASLELHKVYRVLADDEAEREGELRVIDESGEDYLYPESSFVMINLPPSTARILSKRPARHTRAMSHSVKS